MLVLVEWSQLAAQAGVAELGFTGPASLAEIRPLLDDCSFSRVVLGPDTVPVEVSKHVRTVPHGLYRAVLTRDRGCSWHGCDAPPGWCDVAHGETPFRRRGRLKLDNCALLCRRHHRQFDAGNWRMIIDGPSVTYQRTGPASASDTAAGVGRSSTPSSPRAAAPASDGRTTAATRAGPGAQAGASPPRTPTTPYSQPPPDSPRLDLHGLDRGADQLSTSAPGTPQLALDEVASPP